MFKALKENSSIAVEEIQESELLDLCIEHIDCDMSDLYEAQTLNQAINALGTLKVSLETFGLSPALCFMTDSVLLSEIPQIPSLESFLSGNLFDDKAATEAILSKVKEKLALWYTAFKKHLIRHKELYTTVAAVALYMSLAAAAIYLNAKGREFDQRKWRYRYGQTGGDTSKETWNVKDNEIPGVKKPNTNRPETIVETCNNNAKIYKEYFNKHYADFIQVQAEAASLQNDDSPTAAKKRAELHNKLISSKEMILKLRTAMKENDALIKKAGGCYEDKKS